MPLTSSTPPPRWRQCATHFWTTAVPDLLRCFMIANRHRTLLSSDQMRDSRPQLLTDEQNGCYRNTFYGVQTTSATKSRNEGFAARRSRFHPSGSRQLPRLWNAVWRCRKATGTAASQRTPPVADRHNERSPRVQDLRASIGIQSTMLMNPLTNFAN